MPKFTKIRELPSKTKIIALKKEEPESLEDEVERSSGPDYSDVSPESAFMPGLRAGGLERAEDVPQAEQPQSNVGRKRTQNDNEDGNQLYDNGRRRTGERNKYNPAIETSAFSGRTPTIADNNPARQQMGLQQASRINQPGLIRREEEESPLRQDGDAEREYREGQPKTTKRRTDMF